MRFIGIDPSTKTGFVALGEGGVILKQKELSGVGAQDPKRMVTLINEVVAHLKPGDIICIEGFPYSTQKAMFAGGIHHGIRNELYKRNLKYYEVAPNALKKFVGVTGWEGEKGSKRRLTGPQKKKAVMQAVVDLFKFKHSSDNIVDAYILAEIAGYIWSIQNRRYCTLSEYQAEVIQTILKTKGA
jgi:crossover junction endodeoxyribonuclease RuvC